MSLCGEYEQPSYAPRGLFPLGTLFGYPIFLDPDAPKEPHHLTFRPATEKDVREFLSSGHPATKLGGRIGFDLLCSCGRGLIRTGPDDPDPWCAGCNMSAVSCDCAPAPVHPGAALRFIRRRPNESIGDFLDRVEAVGR